MILDIISGYGLRRKRLFHYCCVCSLPWKHACLWSHYLAMATVELLVLQLLPSNRSICHSMYNVFALMFSAYCSKTPIIHSFRNSVLRNSKVKKVKFKLSMLRTSCIAPCFRNCSIRRRRRRRRRLISIVP